MVVLYDRCGDPYNDRAFEREADAINYIYTQIKDDEFLRESFTDAEIEDESYEEWVKRKMKEEGIDETAYIEEIDVY
jgi:hypothetical protein